MSREVWLVVDDKKSRKGEELEKRGNTVCSHVCSPSLETGL